jgi:hypothetical protein
MNINITMPTKHQLAMAASHTVAIASGAFSALFFAGVLTQHQVHDATGDVNRIVADLKDLYGAVAGLIGIGLTAYATVKSGPLASFFRAADAIAADPKKIAEVQMAPAAQQAQIAAIIAKT